MATQAATKPVIICGVLALLLPGCAEFDGLLAPSTQVSLDKRAVERVVEAAQDSGEYVAAAGISEKYATTHPNDFAAQLSFGDAEIEAGRLDKAEQIFAKELKRDPGLKQAHMGLGRIYLATHKLPQALAEFQAAVAADPREIRALNGAGMAADLLGRNREAQKSYRAALAIAPDDRATRNNLGLSLALSGSYEQAVAELSKLAMEPGATPRMRQNLALALGLKGDAAGAAKIARGDLDDKAIAENQRFFEAARRVSAMEFIPSPPGRP